MTPSDSDNDLIGQLAEEWRTRLRNGEQPDLSEYIHRYPDLADEIRDLFPAMAMVEGLKPGTGDVSSASSGGGPVMAGKTLERLGDFRILREVGRGGMGIVYEAEQESLGRRVALKVLPSPALVDPAKKKRFEREAKATARLHHTNIVPVYGVGEHEGMQYYVMQFIQGLGLDEVLTELRHLREARSSSKAYPATVSRRQPTAGAKDLSAAVVARSLLTGRYAPEGLGDGGGEMTLTSPPAAGSAAAAGQITPRLASPAGVIGEPTSGSGSSPSAVRLPGQAGQSSLSDSGRLYWHSVARIGLQVAEALEYANGQGIIHRDIKPSNLLLDSQGTVWVTDFGLAKATADGDNLTHTGDIVGTLRYMAPERFRGHADARGDLYSLGLTLYELLVQRPAFDEKDRSKLIHRVTHEEPVPPRRLNAAIPRDLETIVLKAIEREPARRYPTAAALAEDLKRFVDDKPIQARRISTAERLWRWCRRNPELASASGLAVGALAAAMVLLIWLNISKSQANRDIREEQKQTAAALAAKAAEQKKTQNALIRSQDLTNKLTQETKHKEQEQKRTQAALKKSQELTASLAAEQKKTQKALHETKLVSAKLLVERGQSLIERESPALGMLWLARALKMAPADANDMQRVIRTNLAGLEFELPVLRNVLNHYSPVTAVAVSPDGKTVLTANQGTAWLWNTATGKTFGLTLMHRGNITSLAFSPDGKRILTGSQDRTARLWNVATGKAIGKPLVHPGIVLAVAFSPDGKTILTGCQDRLARRWKTADGKAIGPPLENDSPVGQVVFSGDGKRILTGCPGQVVRVWEAATGKPVGRPLLHPNVAWRAAFSPDGETVLTSCFDKKARLWETKTGKLLGQPLEHADVIGPVAFRPDGKVVVTGSSAGRARLWDVATGKPLGQVMRHTELVMTVAFSPDGRTVLTASTDQTARLWDANTGTPVGHPLPHPAAVEAARFSPDGRTIVTACKDMMVRLWERPASRLLQAPLTHRDAVEKVAFSPDGTMVITASGNRSTAEAGEARLWDTATGRPIGPPLLHTKWVEAVAFRPDGKAVVTGSADGTAQLWEVPSGKMLSQPLQHRAAVQSVAFSPDGKMVATGSADHTAQLWDARTGESIGPSLNHANWVYRVAFSPDGKTLATASYDSTGRLWDTATGKPMGQPLRHQGILVDIVYSPAGQTVVTASYDRTARVWDAHTGQTRRILRHPDVVAGLAVSPDGTIIATRSGRTVRLWDATTGKPLGAPLQHGDPVWALAFSPDSQALLTGGRDKTVRLWSVKTGQLLMPPLVHQDTVTSVAFGPDGKRLLTGSSDRTARLWQAPAPLQGTPERLGRWVEVGIGRELTEDNTIRLLDFVTWQRRRTKLMSLGGPPTQTGGTARGNFGWHQRLAAEDAASGHWFAAGWHLGQLIAAQPDDWFAHALRSKIHLQLHDKGSAARDCALALKVGPPDTVRDWFGRQSPDYETDGSWETAVWYLDRLLEARPKDGPAHALRVKARFQLGQKPAAARDVAKALRLGPRKDVQERLRHYALESLTKEQWSNALWYLDRLVQALPRDANLQIGRGKAFAYLGKLDEAAAAYVRAVELNAFYIDAWENAATLRLYRGDVEGYRKICAWELRILKNEAASARNQGAWMCVLGRAAVADQAQAIAWAEKAVAASPQTAMYLHTLAASLYRAGRYEEALQRLDRAVKGGTADRRVVAWLFLAMTHHQLGRPGEARQWLDRAVAWLDQSTPEKPRDAGMGLPVPWQVWLQLQLLRFEAEALLKRSTRAADPASQVGLAHAHARLGQWAEAVTALSKAIEQNPSDTSLHAERGRCFMQLKQWDKAARDFDQAVKLRPDDSALWAERGRCYEQLKQSEKAAADCARAADLMASQLAEKQAAFAKEPEVWLFRRVLADCYRDLADVQRRAGRALAAVETLDQYQKLWPGHATRQFETAKRLAEVIPFIGKDTKFPTAAERVERRRAADLAMAALGRARLAGYANLDVLRTDAALEPLRSRKDFQALEAELARGNDFPAPTGEIGRLYGDREDLFVMCVAVSADGRRAVTGGEDQIVRLWDVATAKEMRRLTGIGKEVYGVSISRDGRRVLVCTDDNVIRLWDTDTGNVTRTFRGHTGWVWVASFLPGERRFLSGGRDNVLRLWDVATGKEIRRFIGHTNSVLALAVSADGTRALSGGYDNTLRLWDMATGKEIRNLKGHQDYVSSVVFSADGRRAVSGSYDGFMRLWDLDRGKEIRHFKGHWDIIRSVALSPDGHRILSAGHNSKLILWDAATGQMLHQFVVPGNQVAIAYLPDGHRAISCGAGGMVHLWDLSEAAGRIGDMARLGQEQRAEEAYAKVLKDSPKDPLLPFERGQWRARQGDAAAAGDLSLAARLRPHDPYVLSVAANFFRRYGTDLARQGQASDARRRWQQAQEMYEKLFGRAPEYARQASAFTDLLLSSAADWKVLEQVRMTSANGAAMTRQLDGSILVSGKNPDTDILTITARTGLPAVHGLRLEALPDPSLPDLGPGRAGNFLLSHLRVTAVMGKASGKTVPVVLKNAFATYSNPAGQVSNAIDKQNTLSGWGIWPRVAESHTAYFELEGIAGDAPVTSLTIVLEFNNATPRHVLGRFRLSVTAQPLPFAMLTRPDTGGWTKLAALHYDRGDWPAAREALRQATIASAVGTDMDYLLLALVHGRSGQPDLARKALDKGLAWMDRNPADTIVRGLAVDALTAALARRPNDPILLERRGHELARLGKRTQAVADYCKAARLQPHDPKWPIRQAQLQPDVVAFWNFDVGSRDGWEVIQHCKLAVSGHYLQLQNTGPQPLLACRLAGPAGWLELTIRARVQQPLVGRLAWGTAPAKGAPFSVDRNQWFALAASGKQWKEYRVIFHPNSAFEDLGLELGTENSNVQVESLTLRRLNEEKNRELVRQFSQALELSPDSLKILMGRGDLYARLGQRAKAEADFAAAYAIDALRTLARHRKFVDQYQAAHHWSGWVAHLDPQIKVEKDPRQKAALVAWRGELHGRLGEWQLAAADYVEATTIDPSEHWNWYCRASLRFYLDGLTGYRADCQEMLRLFGQTLDPIIAERVAKICLLAPGAAAKVPLHLAVLATSGTEKHWAHYWFLLVRGLAEYRAGHFPSAIAWLRKCQQACPHSNLGSTCRATAYLVLAMANARGEPADRDKARQALRRGVAIFHRLGPKDAAGDFEDWNNWVLFQILRKEAEAAVKGGAEAVH